MQLILFEVCWLGIIFLIFWMAGRRASREVDY